MLHKLQTIRFNSRVQFFEYNWKNHRMRRRKWFDVRKHNAYSRSKKIWRQQKNWIDFEFKIEWLLIVRFVQNRRDKRLRAIVRRIWIQIFLIVRNIYFDHRNLFKHAYFVYKFWSFRSTTTFFEKYESIRKKSITRNNTNSIDRCLHVISRIAWNA